MSSTSEIKDALKMVKAYTKGKEFKKLADIINFIGSLYRKDGDIRKARNYYRQTLGMSEYLEKGDNAVPLALRNLAEIAAEKEDSRDDIIRAMDDYQKAAQLSHVSQIQLSLHVSAWIYEKLYTRGKSCEGDLQKAASFGKKSIACLEKHSSEIDQDKEETQIGGNSKRRLGNIKRLLSEIYVHLNDVVEADKLWKEAECISRNTNDDELYYELLLTRSDFPIITLKEYLFNMKKLVQIAPATKKADATMELSLALLCSDEIELSFNELMTLFANKTMKQNLSQEEQDLLDQRIVDVYLMKKYRALANKDNSARREQRKMYEKIADLASCFGSDWKMLSLAMVYYMKMLHLSDTESEKKEAIESLAVTSFEMARDKRAKESWKTALEYNSNLYANTHDLKTKGEIFEINCYGGLKCLEHLKSDFHSLIIEVPNTSEFFKSKGSIYEAFAFATSKINAAEANKCRKKAKELKHLMKSSSGPEPDVIVPRINNVLSQIESTTALRELNEMALSMMQINQKTADVPGTSAISDIELLEDVQSNCDHHRFLDREFIVNDIPSSKKRRSSGEPGDQKRRKSDKEHTSYDSLAINSFGEARQGFVKSSIRRSRLILSDDEDHIGAASPPDALPTINVTVRCFDDSMQTLRPSRMDPFPRDSTILAIRSLYETRLDTHQRQFDLRQDEIELADTILVSSLPSSNRSYVVNLVLKPVTALSIYLANSGCLTNTDIVKLLGNREITKNMNLSASECDDELTLVLKAVAESNTQICELLLDKCHIKEDAYKYLDTIMPNAAKISLKSTAISSRFLEFAVKTDIAQFGVTIMDLSFTNLKCGKSLASLLKLTPQLKELILRGVDISQGESDLSFSICGLSKLQKLDLTCCD